ncbi:MAG: hypothetical protein Q4C70_05535 [Planctomycetia bacterium]|nr:hypothetical protein [Planctomycetia bacterium]
MFKMQKNHLLTGSFALLLVLGVSAVQAACPCFRNGDGMRPCNNSGTWSRSWNKPAMPPYDRPFPLGQVSDAFNETQQTNAEAADFILYDYEFVGETATLNPKGRDHMIQIARRLPHVPFPIVVEMTEKTNDVKENQHRATIDETRRANVVMWLQKFYADDPSMNPQAIAGRVVIAPDFNYQMRADEAISSFNNSSLTNGSTGNYGGGYAR